MKKQHKKYKRPKKKYEQKRMDEENVLLKKYGLKNKKEVWKTTAKVEKLRNHAKKLLVEDVEKQGIFLKKLNNMGLIGKDARIDDVLALTITDLLERRLQTILVKKKIANTPKQARQMIVHKHVIVGDNVVNIPSYTVPITLENDIKLKKKIKKEKIEINPGQQAEQQAEELENAGAGKIK